MGKYLNERREWRKCKIWELTGMCHTGFPIYSFICGSPTQYQHCPPHIDFLIDYDFQSCVLRSRSHSHKHMTVFGLHLGGPPRYIKGRQGVSGTPFYHFLFEFFLSIWEHDGILDRLTSRNRERVILWYYIPLVNALIAAFLLLSMLVLRYTTIVKFTKKL